MRATNHGPTAPKAAVGVLAALLLAATMTVAVGPSAPAAAAGDPVAMDTYRDLAIDPLSGRLFLTGDDVVVAYAPDGSLLTTFTGVSGASTMAFAAGHLWVTQSTSALAQIDPATLQRDADVPTGAPASSLAAVDGKLWFTTRATSGTGATPTVKVLDPSTGVVSARGSVPGSSLEAVPGSTSRLLVDSSSATAVAVVDITTDPVTVVGETPYLFRRVSRDLAPTEVGTFATSSPGSQSQIAEMSIVPDAAGVLHTTGVRHRTFGTPNAVAATPGRGGLFATTEAGTNDLNVFRQGIPTATHHFTLPAQPMDGGLALSADGTRAYVVTQEWPVIGVALRVVSLVPTVSSTSVTTIPRGRSTRTVVTGTGLGSITAATLGGAAVDVGHDGTDRLELDVRTAIAPGPSSLVLSGPFGALAIAVTVVANGTGTIRGTVRSGRTPASGATVTITDERGAARATTTGSDGTYAFAGAANGTWDVTIVRGGAHHAWPDQVLDGAGPWTYDLDLRSAPASGLERRRTELPPGEVRRLIVDPVTQRTFVAVGDEVVAYDPDGRLVGRIPAQWSASDLQVVGGTLYAMLGDAGKISLIDPATLTVTRTVTIPRTTTGSLAIVNGDAVVAHDDGVRTRLAIVDLASGAVTDVDGSHSWPPVLAPVDGAGDQLVAGQTSAPRVRRLQLVGSTLQERASTASALVDGSELDLVASASADRLWSAGREELTLSTLQPTGVTYPSSGWAVARSAGRGGVLAFGRSVVRQSLPVQTHLLPAEPAARASALDAAGDRSTVATESGLLVQADLAPVVNVVGPQPVVATPATATVTGEGLGAATAITVDGKAVAFTVTDDQHLELDLPGLARGDHLVTVTTPWGASSPRLLHVTAPHDPFPSWGALVDRQYRDLTDTAPTAADRSRWIAQLTAGTRTPGDLVEALRHTADNTRNVDPVARLYQAFLGRIPDASGLRYWVGRKRSGTWSVTRMADHFAASTEFRRTYGTLSNQEFVARIYRDVLGRVEDPSGIAYWTGKLDRRERTRGQLMVGFSESAEYRRSQAATIHAVVAHVFLLGRSPSPAEVEAWRRERPSGDESAPLFGALLTSAEYEARIDR